MLFPKCEWFFQLVIMSRHVGCHIIINHHALSQHRLLNPLMRSQIDWPGLYKTTNQKVTEVVFWEYLSQCSDIQNKESFLGEVRERTKGTFDKKTRRLIPNYARMLVNIPSGKVSWDYAEFFKASMEKNMSDNKTCFVKTQNQNQEQDKWTLVRYGDQLSLTHPKIRKQESKKDSGSITLRQKANGPNEKATMNQMARMFRMPIFSHKNR